MQSGTVNFASPDAAAASPLAARLFAVDGVAGVFLGADFVSVAKRESASWTTLEARLRDEVAAHFEAGAPVITDAAADEVDDDGADGPVAARIRELLDERVRPQVAMDGGDIVYRGFEDGVVYLGLRGACVGCPSSAATLRIGVENLLKYYVPDVVRVEEVGAAG